MIDFDKFKAVVFDFDGTLVLSNAIKRECYLAVAEKYPNGYYIATKLLDTTPPIGDRYSFFYEFTKMILGHEDADLTNSLVDAYSIRAEQALLSCSERPGAMQLLTHLNGFGIPLFLNSGTPRIWLDRIVNGRGMRTLFNEIYGGPIKKSENLKLICAKVKINPGEILVIGDGQDDKDYALESNCIFIPVAGGTLTNDKDAIHHYFDLISYDISKKNQGSNV